jgi:hypothetical protein
MAIDKLPSAPTVDVVVRAAVLADWAAANCVTPTEKELANAEVLTDPVMADVLLDEKVFEPHVSDESNAAEASCKLANWDFTVPNEDNCVCSLLAFFCSWISGCFSTAANWVTMELISRPLPTPGEDMAICAPCYWSPHCF